MKHLLTLAVVVTAATVLAACGGSGSTGSANDGTTTVSVKQLGDRGGVLVDSSGRALYASDQESGGNVLCMGACNDFWKPLTVGAGAPTSSDLTGKLGVARRPDGTRQVTYNGKLLYSFSEDRPGQVTGDGFADAFGRQKFTWHVVNAGGTGSAPAGGGGSSSQIPGY